MMQLDYQAVIDLAAQVLYYSIPIGTILAMAERLGNMFISAVTGEKRVKL